MSAVQSFFQSLPYFIILIGLLVFVHEAGHFLFAKLFKVKVHVFSLGFGPKIVGFQKGETLYKISALPLGGYVKMLGEDPTEAVGPEDKGRAFADKPPWQRLCIILGGPAMNIVFPLFLHFGAGLSMTETVPAEVGFLLSDMPAWQAGIRLGDKVIAIDDEKIQCFDDLVRIVEPAPGKKMTFKILRDGKELTVDLVPKPTVVSLILDEKETVGRIGVAPDYLTTVTAVSNPDSAAGKAGILQFDYIVAVDGTPVERLVDLEKLLVAAQGKAVSLKVRAMKKDAAPPFQPFDEQFDKMPRTLTLTVPEGATTLADIGIEPSMDFVAHVTQGGAAAAIGLKRGDKIVSLNGAAVTLTGVFSALNTSPNDTVQLGWTRGGQKFEAEYKQKFIPAGEAKDLGIKQDAYDSGFWGFRGKSILPTLIPNPALLLNAFRRAVDETWAGIRLIGIGFKLLVQGKVSMRSIGGVIMIGKLAGEAGQAGAGSFFWVMALISLNLGILNLLPIPVLDGGQIVIIAVESIIRRTLSRTVKEKIMLFGVAMLLMLMVFATWNDIARLFVG
jgi:regulator of sigma E protease